MKKSPGENIEFPAEHLTTELNENELIKDQYTGKKIAELEKWLIYKNFLNRKLGLGRIMKKNKRVLFHGPPGTGKALTAKLLGKKINRDVYRINLAGVVSKYIGDAEKQIASLFDRAENENWILFFEEADALYGNSTACDLFENPVDTYLLQRIEGYGGLVILSTTGKSRIHNGIMRKIKSEIYFPPSSAS
jgi:SpoVK/Ycf46/Vps4 family AAA+-type ATPase